MINIPKSHWNIENYNATLGHIVNHNFVKANAQFNRATHPRFGSIRTVVALRNIKKGEEILCNYNYDESFAVPDWYATAYKKDMKKPWPGKFVYKSTNL